MDSIASPSSGLHKAYCQQRSIAQSSCCNLQTEPDIVQLLIVLYLADCCDFCCWSSSNYQVMVRNIILWRFSFVRVCPAKEILHLPLPLFELRSINRELNCGTCSCTSYQHHRYSDGVTQPSILQDQTLLLDFLQHR